MPSCQAWNATETLLNYAPKVSLTLLDPTLLLLGAAAVQVNTRVSHESSVSVACCSRLPARGQG